VDTRDSLVVPDEILVHKDQGTAFDQALVVTGERGPGKDGTQPPAPYSIWRRMALAEARQIDLDLIEAVATGNLIDDAGAAALAKELRPSFSGELLAPGDAGYDAARTIWNAMIDRRPGLIARCASTEDVAAAVRLARKHGLLVSVRGGGHGVSGKALCDGGVTIDLSRMRQVSVDAGRRLVRVGGGSLLGDIDEATAEHGMVVPVGIVSVGDLALEQDEPSPSRAS